MRYIYFILLIAFVSCNQANEKKETPAPVATAPAVQPEDPITVQLRTAVTAIEKKELELASAIKWIYIDNIRHEMITLKDFYTIKKEELAKEMKFSSNKEKTKKALAYLDKMVKEASSNPDVYKVTFHMKALLINSIVYDEEHTKFLKKDLSEITVVFPN
jgi:hypothetical protein